MTAADILIARRRRERRNSILLWVGSFALALVLFVLALRLMGPSPPRHLVLAAGPEEGVYHQHAEAYAAALADEGIEVEVLATAGSVENLEHLAAGEADLALVQGGTARPDDAEHGRSLASVFMEPLWLVRRRDVAIESLGDLEGLRVAAGPPGSGTRALLERLLEANGSALAPAADAGAAGLHDLAGREAADALRAGRVDLACFVIAPEASFLPPLLAAPDVALVPLPRAAAYERLYRFLDQVTLPRGVLDLANDVPAEDVDLIASTASIAARDDLHAAIVPLVIEAARRIHGGGSLLAEAGRFPSPNHVDLPLADDARRFFEHGPSWIYRVFPFWLASFLDRAVILLLPLLTLLLPLLKTAPPLYRWGMRRRIYRWYRVVRDADQVSRDAEDDEALRAELEKVRAIESEIADVAIPLSYMAELYDLRLHMAFVERRIEAQLAS